ncbi:DNA-processing protein DprA [Latilactobacillus fuchuensis]|uniref:DNA processing protein, DprA/SMF family n=1 Tax=Latilactobacillus fuchuensis TaxID=164393 RepID=A0A2N9DVK0_9LACO|nr:DNA-processing protein DprA [Latilactobacillus fuchuensis]SPC38521.1 DNA processing protein, DprA/SMF family [Latilactobacillus fuchuensis]
MVSKRQLLLKVHLAAGFGLTSELRLATWLLTSQNWELSAVELAQIGRLPERYWSTFQASFQSATLQCACEYHEQFAAYLTIIDEAYPQRLLETYQPPIVIFYRGALACLKQPALGIVGARQAGPYTKLALHQLESLPTTTAIISGLAQGADAMAHQWALQQGRAPIGVIGTGLNCCYPPQNEQLQQTVAQCGLLLSEYPLDTPARKFQFPARNRIIAGLCHGLLVTEARQRSGSLITANLALQANRNVYAVPGRLDQSLSAGCNQLILAGATPLLNATLLTDELRYFE